MDKDTLHEIYQRLCQLVIQAGVYVRSATDASRSSTEAKENYADLVTEYDQNTEKMLISGLSEAYPNHRFIGEEKASSGEKYVFTDEPTWIIDPIDGTTNFVHSGVYPDGIMLASGDHSKLFRDLGRSSSLDGTVSGVCLHSLDFLRQLRLVDSRLPGYLYFPAYAISVALYVKKEAMIGVVYDIAKDLFYSAIKGEGAFCNGRLLHVNKPSDLQSALIMAEYGNQRDPEFLQFKLDQMSKLIKRCHGIRCLGSAALNGCAVAAGQVDAYFEYGLHIWDMAACYLIATEAGAVCCNPTGGPLDLLSRKFLVASSQSLADQMSSVLEDFDVERD